MDIQNRPRGSLVEPRRVAFLLERRVEEKLNDLAHQAGTSKSAMVQWLIDQAEVNNDGVPLDWPTAVDVQQHLDTEARAS